MHIHTTISGASTNLLKIFMYLFTVTPVAGFTMEFIKHVISENPNKNVWVTC